MAARAGQATPVPGGDDYRRAFDTFQLAMNEELRLLELQRAQIDNMRQRAVQFLAFVGSATAFLVANALTAVNAADRDLTFHIVAGIATGLSLLAIFLAFTVLVGLDLRTWSLTRWSWGLKRGSALRHATSEVPQESPENLAHKLAELYQEARERNAPKLRMVQWTFVAFLMIGSLQVVAWTVLVWVKA